MQDIRYTFVNHLLQNTQPVEIFWAVIVLHVDHHDVLHTAIVLQLLHVLWKHVIGTDDFDLFFFGLTAPRRELDVLAGDPFDEQNIGIFGCVHQPFRIVAITAKNENTTVRFGGEPISVGILQKAVCGRKGFDLAFRQNMAKVLPTSRLKPIDRSSSIFNYPHKITTLGVTPTLAQEFGKAAMPPVLEGIDVEGNMVVIYSRFGVAGGWEMSQSPYARGCNAVGSVQVGQNVLMYAVTQ